jgi:hypothetical protein
MDCQTREMRLREAEQSAEKVRQGMLHNLQQYGVRPIGDLEIMSENERTKWFFWNMHERLDATRASEPMLVGKVMQANFLVSDGQSAFTENWGLEKRIEINCKWHLLLKDQAYQKEDVYPINDGRVELYVGDSPPAKFLMKKRQKAHLDADNSLFPNCLLLSGWITEGLWSDLKISYTSQSRTCQTALFLRDNSLFPIKPGFDFVSGPPGALGVTNIEFRVSSNSLLSNVGHSNL